jgi:hypothetical protein
MVKGEGETRDSYQTYDLVSGINRGDVIKAISVEYLSTRDGQGELEEVVAPSSRDCNYFYLFSLIINAWPVYFKFMFIPHEFVSSIWIYI